MPFLGVRIDDETSKKLEELCKDLNIEKSELIRRLVKNADKYLTGEEIGVIPLKGFIPIKVKYANKCALCGEIVNIKDNAMWHKETKQIVHMSCYTKTRTEQIPELIVSDVCLNLLKVGDKYYCCQERGKARKLLSIKQCDICQTIVSANKQERKKIHVKQTLPQPNPIQSDTEYKPDTAGYTCPYQQENQYQYGTIYCKKLNNNVPRSECNPLWCPYAKT